jgi:hypothetical protein
MAKKELLVLIPNRSFATSAGEIVLKPFKFKQFSQALEIVQRYFDLFSTYEGAEAIAKALFEKVENGNFEILDDIDLLIDLVSGVKVSESDLAYDEVIGLLVEVIDMNMDFFSRISQKIAKTDEKATEPSLKTGEDELAA